MGTFVIKCKNRWSGNGSVAVTHRRAAAATGGDARMGSVLL